MQPVSDDDVEGCLVFVLVVAALYAVGFVVWLCFKSPAWGLPAAGVLVVLAVAFLSRIMANGREEKLRKKRHKTMKSKPKPTAGEFRTRVGPAVERAERTLRVDQAKHTQHARKPKKR